MKSQDMLFLAVMGSKQANVAELLGKLATGAKNVATHPATLGAGALGAGVVGGKYLSDKLMESYPQLPERLADGINGFSGATADREQQTRDAMRNAGLLLGVGVLGSSAVGYMLGNRDKKPVEKKAPISVAQLQQEAIAQAQQILDKQANFKSEVLGKALESFKGFGHTALNTAKGYGNAALDTTAHGMNEGFNTNRFLEYLFRMGKGEQKGISGAWGGAKNMFTGKVNPSGMPRKDFSELLTEAHGPQFGRNDAANALGLAGGTAAAGGLGLGVRHWVKGMPPTPQVEQPTPTSGLQNLFGSFRKNIGWDAAQSKQANHMLDKLKEKGSEVVEGVKNIGGEAVDGVKDFVKGGLGDAPDSAVLRYLAAGLGGAALGGGAAYLLSDHEKPKTKKSPTEEELLLASQELSKQAGLLPKWLGAAKGLFRGTAKAVAPAAAASAVPRGLSDFAAGVKGVAPSAAEAAAAGLTPKTVVGGLGYPSAAQLATRAAARAAATKAAPGPMGGLAALGLAKLVPRVGGTLTGFHKDMLNAGNAAIDASSVFSAGGATARGVRGVGRFAANHPLATAGGAALGSHIYTRNKAEDVAAQAYRDFAALPWYKRMGAGWNPDMIKKQLPGTIQHRINTLG